MKAAIYKEYGLPENVLTVQDIEIPLPKDGEIQVNIHAATVNRTDCGIVEGKPFVMRVLTGLFNPRVETPGTDFAGVITCIGKDVTLFKKGDRVFGFHGMGFASHAEYLTISEKSSVISLPKKITYQNAAASIEGVHYGQSLLNKVNIKQGDHILVNSGTGAIGSAMIQLLQQYCVMITATAPTEQIDLVRGLGAARVIDYQKANFIQVLKDEKQRYDFIFDVAGKSSYRRCKKLLKSKGIYISSKFGTGIHSLFSRRIVISKDIKISLELVRRVLKAGQYSPVIDRSYTLDQIQEAYQYVKSGKKIGNVLLSF